MQAHDLHQHLIAIRRAIEGACPGTVVRLSFALEQRVTADLALRKQLTDLCLFIVRHARGHGPTGHHNCRQMAELERADEQSGHDLVAHAQRENGIKHVVRQRNGGRHRDHVTAEQRYLHARLALSHAVAHGRHAARKLSDRADLARRLFEQRRKTFQRLMGRQHVVVGRNDGDVGLDSFAQRQLFIGLEGRTAVRQVGAGQTAAHRQLLAPLFDALQVGRARWRAAHPNARGHGGHNWMNWCRRCRSLEAQTSHRNPPNMLGHI